MIPPPRTGVWVFPNQPATELVDVIVGAEDLGIDEFWLGDEGPAREPLTILGAAAIRTNRIRLATGITNPYVRHPVITTSSMLTVHELSRGRGILGVGVGGHMSLAPLGLTADRPVGALADFIAKARAVCDGEAIDGYEPPEYAITWASAGVPMPVFVGARGEKLNRLASEFADGAFVAGMPPFRYDDVIGWARSARPIDIALCPSVAFTENDIERHRPEMIWSLYDTPAEVRAELGLDVAEVRAAAEALREGDARPASRILDDEMLEQVMLLGSPRSVGARLADLVVRHRPDSIGLALILEDLAEGVKASAEAFAVMTQHLARAQEDAV